MSGFKDDPRAEEYDKYGRVFRKETVLNRSTSSLGFIKDYQEALSKEIVSKYNMSNSRKKTVAKDLAKKFNQRTSKRDKYFDEEENKYLRLTSEEKKSIIRKTNLAKKKERFKC